MRRCRGYKSHQPQLVGVSDGDHPDITFDLFFRPGKPGKADMSTKFIYWRPDFGTRECPDGKMWANIHIVGRYNGRKLSGWQKLMVELRNTFPFISEEEINCSIVYKSTWCQGCIIVQWNGYVSQGEYPGWLQRTWTDGRGGPDYQVA